MGAPERYDAVVIGSGSGGRRAAWRLSGAGLRVAIVESELFGGECPFWACMPSKALLRAPEVVSQAHHAAGVTDPAVSWPEVREYRDQVNSGLDDGQKAASYAERGIEIIRGRGRLLGPGMVDVDGRRLETERVIVATGSAPAVPDVPGLGEAEFWTNREATSLREVPQSTAVLGGGPVGVELGQMLSRYGSRVTIIEAADRLLEREDPGVSELLDSALRDEGIDIRTSAAAERVESSGGATSVRLGDGQLVEAQRLLVASGRRPRVEGLGLEAVGVRYNERGIDVDERCRAAPGVWAVGDVTGIAPFTHVAAYQGRIAAADILGAHPCADYRAIPRVVFSDPEVAAVGLTQAQAEEDGVEVVRAVVDLDEVERSQTYGRDLSGRTALLADATSETVVGAWAVGPLASEWIHGAVVAVRARLPVSVLRDTIMQFPTFSEALTMAAERLELPSDRR